MWEREAVTPRIWDYNETLKECVCERKKERDRDRQREDKTIQLFKLMVSGSAKILVSDVLF